MAKFDTFEEYRLFVEDTTLLSERRQTISNIYVAVNSLLMAAIGLLFKELGAQGVGALLLPFPLITAGIAISLWWRQLIGKYKQLIGLRIDMLRKMENEMPESIKKYHAEDRLYPRNAAGEMVSGKGLNFSDLEARLPVLFVVLYCLFGVGTLTVLLYEWLY